MSNRWEHDYGHGLHALAPANPTDGAMFACSCGVTYEFVVLDDGLPGEWVQVAGD